MKTQVFKNIETTAISNLLVLAAMIILSGILLFANNYRQSLLKNRSFNEHSKPAIETFYLNSIITEEAVSAEDETIQNPASETKFSMAKLQEYLIPENEPELTISIANSIVFPEVNTGKFSAENNTVNNDNFLLNLKHQANEKTREAVEYYVMEKKVKEFLSIETEKPLCLEDWMLNRKCWSGELNVAIALSEGK